MTLRSGQQASGHTGSADHDHVSQLLRQRASSRESTSHGEYHEYMCSLLICMVALVAVAVSGRQWRPWPYKALGY